MAIRWRSMKTAPKDGTLILVCSLFSNGDLGMDVTAWDGRGWWQHRERPPHKWRPLPKPPQSLKDLKNNAHQRNSHKRSEKT